MNELTLLKKKLIINDTGKTFIFNADILKLITKPDYDGKKIWKAIKLIVLEKCMNFWKKQKLKQREKKW